MFRRLAAVYPEGVRGVENHMFWFDLDSDDVRVQQIIDVLGESGRTPVPPKYPIDSAREYELVIRRVYDQSDWEAAEFLELLPIDRKELFGGPRPPQVRLSHLRSKADFLGTEGIASRAIVPDRVRRAILGAKMAHAAIDKVVPIRRLPGSPREHVKWELARWKDIGPPWWELWSDFTMPPVSPRLKLLEARGFPVPPGYDKHMVGIDEGFYTSEIHYRRADVEALPPVDVALSAENNDQYKWIIVSQRFYRLCVEKGWKVSFAPVRIDQE